MHQTEELAGVIAQHVREPAGLAIVILQCRAVDLPLRPLPQPLCFPQHLIDTPLCFG